MVALQQRRSPRTYPMGPPAEDIPSPRICDIAGKRDEEDQRTPQSWWPDVILLMLTVIVACVVLYKTL